MKRAVRLKIIKYFDDNSEAVLLKKTVMVTTMAFLRKKIVELLALQDEFIDGNNVAITHNSKNSGTIEFKSNFASGDEKILVTFEYK